MVAKVSKSQAEAIRKYDDKAYDKVLLRLKKNSELSKQNIQAAATKSGESLNGYITNAVKMRMENENK